MLPELLASEGVLDVMDLSVRVQDSLWVIVVFVTILALNSYHLTVFSQMLFQALKGELVKVPTEALQGVARAVSSLNMALEVRNHVDVDVACSSAPVANQNFVKNVKKHLRTDVSEGV